MVDEGYRVRVWASPRPTTCTSCVGANANTQPSFAVVAAIASRSACPNGRSLRSDQGGGSRAAMLSEGNLTPLQGPRFVGVQRRFFGCARSSALVRISLGRCNAARHPLAATSRHGPRGGSRPSSPRRGSAPLSKHAMRSAGQIESGPVVAGRHTTALGIHALEGGFSSIRHIVDFAVAARQLWLKPSWIAERAVEESAIVPLLSTAEHAATLLQCPKMRRWTDALKSAAPRSARIKAGVARRVSDQLTSRRVSATSRIAAGVAVRLHSGR